MTISFNRGAMVLCAIATWMTVVVSAEADTKFGTPLPGQPLPNPKNLKVVKPDLIIVSVAPGSTPSKPAVITVRNAGDGAASATNVKLSCAARFAPGSSSNCQFGSINGAVGALAPGAMTTVTVETGALGKSGRPLISSTVNACLDSANTVHESNEANNCGHGNW